MNTPMETWEEYDAKKYGLQTAILYNSAFAGEVQSEIAQKGGSLTLAEYIAIDQFGINGFHNRNKTNREIHGATDMHERWKNTVPVLMEMYGLSHVIEFGPGRGDLALGTLKKIKEKGGYASWDFIEIDAESRIEIEKRLDQADLNPNKGQIVPAIEDLKGKKKALAVLAYSLDSMPPQCFVRTVEGKGPPDKIIGVAMTGNTIQEIYLTDEQLLQRGIKYRNGFFQDSEDNTFDLNLWRMNKKGQRAYIPMQAYASLVKLSKILEAGSAVLIIDELGISPKSFASDHLLPPKFISRSMPQLNPKELYQQPGKELLYYPLSYNGIAGVLERIGVSNIQCDTEESMAMELRGEQFVQWRPGLGRDLRYSFLGIMGKPAVLQSPIIIPSPYRIHH